MIPLLLSAALTVLPADRLAMADRLFNRGRHAEAAKEYRELEKEPSVARDEILFRLGECERVGGDSARARGYYRKLIHGYPESRHLDQARFLDAMGASGEERRRLLTGLDSDRVKASVRAAALYHLGVDNSDAEALRRCAQIEPKGKYRAYADLRRAMLYNDSADAKTRRNGIDLLLGLAFGGSELAPEAMYLAAIQTYRDRRYSEARSLFSRYRKNFPKGEHAEEAKTMSIWCDFLEGRYSDAALACGDGGTDDLDYLRAATAYSSGEEDRALELFKEYLEKYPRGRYRADAELPVARIEFDRANRMNDAIRTVESAKRGFFLSKLAADELRLAWAYEKSGRLPEAIAEYVKIAADFAGTPEAAEALFQRAMIEARAEHWPAVELSLAEALKSGRLTTRRGEALYWRGIAAFRLSHEAEGAKLLSEALETGIGIDEAREARLMLADRDYREGREAEAKAAYAALVREGACDRMSAAQVLAVGRLLLPGEEAELCAKALSGNASAEWRQSGWTLLGLYEEKRGAATSAIAAYRKALAEKARTDEAAIAALNLGRLESRGGEYDLADRSLKQAVELNSANSRARAEAYLALARNSESRGDFHTACAYATVLASLFDDETLLAEARKILDAHPEEAKQE